MDSGKSEVARCMEQIRLEYESAQRGLLGLAYGMSQHEELVALIGPEQAIKLVAKSLEDA